MDSEPNSSSPNIWRTVLILVAVGAALLFIFLIFMPGGSSYPSTPFGQVIADAAAGKVSTIEVQGQSLTVTYAQKVNNETVIKSSTMPANTDIATFLTDQGIALSKESAATGQPSVDLVVKSSSNTLGTWLSFFGTIIPILLIGLFIYWIFRSSRGATSQAMGFSRSHARLFAGSRVAVTFADVAGVDEAKEELSEVVEFLKYPEKFAALGARIPKGVLLLGPPGTGKTLLARAVAGEAGVPFFSISGSEFVEMFVGVGASRVRDLFTDAKKNSPCIVFIDEIDAVGRQRGTGLGGSHDEREQTLNQILVEMDGFEPGTNVIVLAATNRPDILDPALLRPGRFDRKVILDAPDIKGREAILRVHLKGKPIDPEVHVPTLAKSTAGFSGADLANLVNEAAILAARRDKHLIGMPEFEEAVDRVIAGPERKSRVMTQQERERTAYHEGGHTVVSFFMEHHDQPHKVTIIARGMAGGYTRFLPDEEAHYRTREMLEDQICAGLAGRVAEDLVFGNISTGASNDLEQVTNLARSMITRWGMSDRLGPRTFGRPEELTFLGRELTETRNYGEKVAEEIDDEVRRIVSAGQERAKQVLIEHRVLLDKLASALLEVETLEGDTLQKLLASDPNEPWTPPTPAPDSVQPGQAPAEPSQPPAEQPAPQERPLSGAAGLRW